MTNLRYRCSALFICVLLVSGMAAAQAPAAEERQEGPGQESVDPDAPMAPVDPKSYVIGAEDHLSIRVWREPEVSANVIVRPDGMITLPLIGEVQAAERTPYELKDAITEDFSEYLTRPEVMVSVIAIRSKKYYITGEVGRTGAVPLVVPTTVLQALSSAGGFGPWANKKKIVILRGSQRLKFNYNEVIKGKKLEQNILLQNGDHIIVP